MANFKTHLLGGVASFGASSYLFWQHGDLENIAYIGFASIIGSLFPDIDSDTSKTIRYFFYGLSFISMIILGNLMYQHNIKFEKLIFVLLSIPVLMIYAVKPIFSELTVHRGIYHSIPMGLVLSLSILYIPFDTNKFIVATSFMFGFLVHLLLDEIYASVTISGLRIRPKKSFGTALKWFAPFMPANIILNSLLVILIFDKFDYLVQNFEIFFNF